MGLTVMVQDLRVGMKVSQAGVVGTVLARPENHPHYPTLALVPWAFCGGHPLGLRVSFDALAFQQIVGELVTRWPLRKGKHEDDPVERWENLQQAMEFINEKPTMLPPPPPPRRRGTW
jgi:hypothetical protein